jgi:NADPH:quinone reductase-like Zn-dependent oxidoreductase
MPRAVRFDHYGATEVLQVVEVDRPVPAAGEALVRVKAAGVNPGEAAVREGRMHGRFLASFPSGERSDLAGVIEEVGEGVEPFKIGDEVIGFTNRRASHAELVLVEAAHMTTKAPEVPWELAGALPIAGMTAYAAVRAVARASGETVAVSAAAGASARSLCSLPGVRVRPASRGAARSATRAGSARSRTSCVTSVLKR